MLFKNGDLTLFQDQAYLALTTFRRNGAPVATPVWFAQEDQRLYIMTGADTGKVRRIRNNAQVEVAPCTISGGLLGPSLEAMARLLHDDEKVHANQVLNRKYGWQKRFYDLTYLLRGRERSYIEITLM
ncbi:MAG: PPOX class F420-dependent oxidoreductase [Anaerolineae bacterium]|nr:PPOX class F420-dependent oxidoreductase [Anaerolineae bacterium]